MLLLGTNFVFRAALFLELKGVLFSDLKLLDWIITWRVKNIK